MKIAGEVELKGNIDGIGDIGKPGDLATANLTLQNTLSTAIGVMTVVAFIWFAFKLVIGAIGIINSGGDKGKIAEARNNITFGLVGVVVIIAAIFIADIVARILGVPLIFNISAMVALLGPS